MNDSSDGHNSLNLKRKGAPADHPIEEVPSKMAAKFSRSKTGLFKDYNHIYADENKTEYSVLLSNEDQSKFNLMNANKILKTCEGLKHIKPVGISLVKIYFENKTQANNFILNKTLLSDNKWLARIPYDNIESHGIIRVPVDITEEELLSDLKASANIIGVKRFQKKIDGGWSPLPTVLVTFLSSIRPDHVTYDYLWFDVQEYVKPVKQCFVCYKFGHSRGSCKAQQICSVCSGDHFFKDCTSTDNPKCPNCNGPHVAVSSICPVKSEKMVEIKNKIKGKVTYANITARSGKSIPTSSLKTVTKLVSSSPPEIRSPQKRAVMTDILNSDTLINVITKTVIDIIKMSAAKDVQTGPVSSKLIKELLITNFSS